jgi:hypothetical protein
VELPPTEKRLVPPAAEKVDSLAHLLFSASAWEILKDYGGLTGTQARETASWVLEVILSAITSGHSPADVKSQMKDKQHRRPDPMAHVRRRGQQRSSAARSTT